MTHVPQSTIIGSFSILILLLSFTNFLIAQDQCIAMDRVYPNQERTDNLLHGDFNGDKIQDLVLVPRIGKGSIRIMYGSPSGLELRDSIMLDTFYHVSAPADMLGDGYDDLLISVGNEIHLYNGKPDGFTKMETYTINLNELLDITGNEASGYAEPYADQNGNGKAEILITAGIGNYTVDDGGILAIMEVNNIKIDIFKSSTGVELASIFYKIPKLLGDINRDGYKDFGFQSGWGSIEIFYGSAEYFKVENKQPVSEDFEFDSELNNIGDVNGDGFNDLLVTQMQYYRRYPTAWIFLGSSTGLEGKAAWSTNSEHPDYYMYEGFGKLSGPVGDVNNDGFDDFFITGNNSLYSHIYLGSADLSEIKKGVRFGFEPYQFINAGDLNGDSKDDYALAYYNAGIKNWEIGVIEGLTSGLNLTPCYKSDQPVALTFQAKFGQSAGDVNKDGYDDIVIGHDQLDPSLEDEWGMIAVITGAPVGTGTGGMGYSAGLKDYFGDQFGSGDFNGDGYTDVIAGEYTRRSVHVFYGSASGMSSKPDVSLTESSFGSGWGESIEEVGDLNGDGFDDFLSYKYGMKLVYGSALGPQIYPGWTFPSFYGYRAGDSNKDGFSDFFLKVPEGYRLFYGSTTGPVMSSYISAFPVIFGGDINGDGFDDMLTSDNTNNSIGILFGNSTGYTEQKNVILNAFNPNGIGDFNGDGYDDIGVSNTLDDEKFLGSAWRVDLYPGSATGIQTTILTTIRSQKKYQNLVAQPRVGDFNGDGFEDLLVSAGLESWLIYGIKGISNIICPSDATLYSDSSCTAILNGFDPPGDPALYQYKVNGTKSFEGTGSINGMQLKTGSYTITYSIKSDQNRFCTFRLIILDTIAPKLIVSDKIIVCNKSSLQLRIPLLKIEDECQIKNVLYEIQGSIYRTGTGLNASGIFNPGESNITWTVTDSSNNVSVIRLNVTVLASNFNVKTPNSYQINAQQSQANTIYLGYANNTLRLTAYEPNSSKHKYLWSNGDTTRFTRVRHNVPGKYEYSVIVTNGNGCSDTAYTTIKVIDNYCPNPLKDFITQYFPQLLNQPWIQALIASTSQMYMCYNGSTVCVSPAQVPAMISNGARLGKCGQIYESNDMITTKEETNSVGALTLSASPNPSGHEFTLKIDGTKGKPYALRIINSVGSPVFMKQGITENIIRAGGSFQKGVYFAEVICGNERKVIRLLKVK